MMVSGMVKKRLKPLVSVVMPAFNAERFLEEAVLSVLGQTLSNFELILLNDGSTDRTRNVIEAFSEHDSRVRFFDFEQNQGKPAVVNFGMNHARGKFACIFDSDDVMVNYKLEVSAGILERHNESGLVYGDAWVINERSRITGPFSFPSRKKRGLDDAFAPNPFSFARLCRKNFIPNQGFFGGRWTGSEAENRGGLGFVASVDQRQAGVLFAGSIVFVSDQFAGIDFAFFKIGD